MDEFHRRPNVVEFVVTLTTKIVVDIDGYVNAVSEGVTGPYLYQGFVKREIPEDRPSFTLDAIAVYAEGEFIAEYDADNPLVVEADDRCAIVIGAEAAQLVDAISDGFQALGGNPSDPAFLTPFKSPEAAESVEPVVEPIV